MALKRIRIELARDHDFPEGSRERGYDFYGDRWGPGVVRLVTSFGTTPEMVDGMLAIGAAEGVSAAPEGGAALAALEHLLAAGVIARQESVVLFNTGGALKYLDVLAR